MQIGLYGDDAPQSVRLFRGLCGDRTSGLPSSLSYRSSTVTRVEKGKSIEMGHLSAGSAATLERSIDSTGYVRTNLVNLADAFTNMDANELSHDRAGLVSMRKGGALPCRRAIDSDVPTRNRCGAPRALGPSEAPRFRVLYSANTSTIRTTS